MNYEILKDPMLNAIYESAIRILAFSAQPERLLRIKLLKKEYRPEDIDAVFELLREERLLDDDDYGANFARELVRIKFYGPNKVAAKLGEKGIDRHKAAAFAASAIEEYGGETAVATRFIKKNMLSVRRLYNDNEMIKLQSKLYNRGFKGLSPALIKDIVEELLERE